MEFGKHLVQGAANTSFPFAVCLLMSFGEIEIAYEWVVHQCLQYDAHETGLAHVIETAEANSATGKEGRVGDYHFVLFGRGRVFILALLACAVLSVGASSPNTCHI
jgi:hypothetical protein